MRTTNPKAIVNSWVIVAHLRTIRHLKDCDLLKIHGTACPICGVQMKLPLEWVIPRNREDMPAHMVVHSKCVDRLLSMLNQRNN